MGCFICRFFVVSEKKLLGDLYQSIIERLLSSIDLCESSKLVYRMQFVS